MRRLLSISLFVIPFGIAFGVAASEQGLSSTQSIGMSVFVFSGAAQFASLDLWTDPIAFASLALITLAVNARHIIMGAALSPWINALSLTQRLTVLAYLCDPNFADSQPALRSGERDLGVFLGGGLIIWVNWIIGTTIGALAGKAIGDLEAYGLDVVMVCFFAATVAGRLQNRTAIAPVAVAAIVAVLSLSWLPAGWNIIVAALAGGLTSVAFHAR